MEELAFNIKEEGETARLGGLLAPLLRRGDVVGLKGDLGAGKTFFAGAVARGLGIPESVHVTSPTFTLIKEYQGKFPIYHMDLYRIGGQGELYDLGLWEYYDGDGVCLVEWCDRFDDLWPDTALVLDLELGKGDVRIIHATGKGRGLELAKKLWAKWQLL